MLVDLDRTRRRVEAMIAETIGVAERTAAYAEDGHASVTGWIKATCNTSSADTKAAVQCARLIHAIPEARDADTPAHSVSDNPVSWPGCSPIRAARTSSPTRHSC